MVTVSPALGVPLRVIDQPSMSIDVPEVYVSHGGPASDWGGVAAMSMGGSALPAERELPARGVEGEHHASRPWWQVAPGWAAS